jgi:hypothetical protein
MKRELSIKDLKQVSKIVKEQIFVPRSEKKVTVFLCGGAVSDSQNARFRMANVFAKTQRYELLYPEDLFDDLLAGQGQHSLLKLENILAESVDSIVLFPESPGSFAELGAFSNNENLAKKMVVVSNKKFKSDKSFINYGPNRLIKASKTGKVTHINYDHLTNDNLDEQNKIYKRINNYIANIRRVHPVEKNVANILEAEHFILPCIYLLSDVDNLSLYKLMHFATSQDDSMCEIATRSAIGRLVQKNFITKKLSVYQVTILGSSYVRDTFSSKHLDNARIEILNTENRRNSKVNYDNI